MEFKEISAFVHYANWARSKREWNVLSGKEKIEDLKNLIDEIHDYKINPILLEINYNYSKFPERKTELEQVYARYLEEIEEAITTYTEKEQAVFSWRIKAIKKKLEMPIYVTPGLEIDKRENITGKLNEKLFERELSIVNLPYKALILKSKTIQKSLFQEYLETTPRPNFHLYLKKYFTDKEIKKGLKEASEMLPTHESENAPNNLAAGFAPITNIEKRISAINHEFIQKRIAGEIDQKYYSHTLESTSTFKALNEIDEKITSAEFLEEKYYSIRAKKIKEILATLRSPNLRESLLQNILNETLWLSFDEDKNLRRRESLFKDYLEGIRLPYLEPEEQPQTEVKKKPGKKPVVIKPAQHYLQNIEFEERKILFLKELKRKFKGCEPKIFNHLIMVLLEIDVLRKATNKELKVSFEKAIESKEQAQQNFDKYIGSREKGKDTQLFISLKRQVSTIMEEKQVV